jgi:serine/threonine protein kinase
MTLSEGQLLHGRYRIEHLVARGGYGAVYKAFDTSLNRICAVKENLAAGPAAERQFEREAQLLARLHHPNLPRVIDHFLLAGRGQYLVMDFVAGRNLHEILRGRLRPYSQEDAIPIILQVCAALHYLHSQTPPIVHRDVKPQNIIVTNGGPVMLVDFGISKVDHGGADTIEAARGLSPGFAAPEQYGTGATDVRSDVYSVGATLYALLTGRPPVDSLQRLTLGLALPPIHQFNAAVSPAVEQVTYKAMEPSTKDRLPTIDLLERELAAAAGRAPQRPWFFPLAAGGAALVIILAIGLLRALPVSTLPPADARATATTARTGTPEASAAVAARAAGPVSPTVPAFEVVATAPPTPSPAPSPTPSPTAPPTLSPTASPTILPTASPVLSPVPASVPSSTSAPPATEAPTGDPPAAPPADPPPRVVPTPYGGGELIIFSVGDIGARDIYSMSPTGSNQSNLTNHPGDDWVGSLSHDERLLLFESDRSGSWDIYLQDLERGGISRVTDDPGADHDPAWSPDGEHILFHSDRSDGVWRLYTVAPNGADVRVLTHDPRGSWAGAWSPAGDKIVFSVNFAGPADIYVMDADGSNLINLTNSPSHESAAHWSPDGAFIAFYSDRDGNREIYMMDANGANPRRLTFDAATDTTPTWSPDGRHIVFASDRGGRLGIYSLELATGAVTQLTTGAQPEGSPSWAPY